MVLRTSHFNLFSGYHCLVLLSLFTLGNQNFLHVLSKELHKLWGCCWCTIFEPVSGFLLKALPAVLIPLASAYKVKLIRHCTLVVADAVELSVDVVPVE